MRQIAIALILAASAAGCNPYSPDDNRVDPFSGTVQPLGQSDHQYNFSRQGELIVTFTSVTPTPASGQLRYGFGSMVNGVCAPFALRILIVNNQENLGQVQKGSACLAIVDGGAIRAATQYAGTVSYP